VTTQTAAAPDLAWSPSAESPPPVPGASPPVHGSPGQARGTSGRSGPIPIRPLSLGEILDGAVSLLRLYPGPLLGLAALVMSVQLLLTVPVQYLSQDFSLSIFSPIPSSGGNDLNPLLALFGIALSATIGAVIAGLCAGVVSGMAAAVVGRSATGQPVTISAVWADVRPRIWALIGLSLVIGLATAIGSLFFLVGAWPVGAIFALAVPAMMLERVGPIQAIRRGWRLIFTNFWAFARLFLIRVLATVIVAGIWTFLVAGPFEVASQVILSLNAPQSPSPGQILLSVFASGLGAMVSGIVVIPFLGCVDALLYVDRRMRAEGYDIELGQRLRASARRVA